MMLKLNGKYDEDTRKMASALSGSLGPIQDLVEDISKRNGDTAKVISAVITDGMTMLGNRIDNVLSRPVRLSVTEQNADDN